MSKKTTRTETAGSLPVILEAKVWWTRAAISLAVGIFTLWVTYMVPNSFLGVCLGIIGFATAIVLPVVFIVIAILKETDQI